MVVNKAMMLEPTARYQSPAAMLADLELAERQLTEGGDMRPWRPMATAACRSYSQRQQQTVLVVESSPRWQDIFRDGFKRVNYRVLVTADPKRALARVRTGRERDCNASSSARKRLGKAALEAFNELGERQPARPGCPRSCCWTNRRRNGKTGPSRPTTASC